MTRAELAELVGQHVWEHHGVVAPIDRKYLGRLERGEVRWPNARYRQALREILGRSSDRELGFHSANSSRTAKELEPVDRRSFFKAAAGGGVAIVGRDHLTGSDLVAGDPWGELHLVVSKVEQLERNDAASGGGGDQLKEAIGLYRRVTGWRNERTGSLRMDDALSRLQGDIGGWVGWLAYDAGKLASARRYLTATIVHARTSDLPDIEIRAMSYLVLLLNRKGHHRDALQCAEAAQRIAAQGAPPKVRSLLHMRAAAAHAALADEQAYRSEVAAAYRAYGQRSATPDPLWAQFVTEAELQGLCGDSLTVLGEHRQAADAFRSIAESLDERFHRNRAYYSAKLAASLLAQGDVAEASVQALAVLPEVTSLESHRVRTIIDDVQAGVAPYQERVPAARDLVHACTEALSA
jgi:tetratricopeptide (TPR) repeat protein